MHVLLIEDDPLVASGIRAGLMMYHFVVEHVTSLQAARQAMQSVASDVVILDRGLPDGDGLTLLQAWRDEGSPRRCWCLRPEMPCVTGWMGCKPVPTTT